MIQTKVARILSPTEVVLAAGENEGVRTGMTFVIYALSDEIKDPDSGESLGQLELVKGRVKVTHAQAKMSVAETETRVIKQRVDMFETFNLVREVSKIVADQLKVEGAKPITSDPTVREGDLARSL